MTLWHYLPDHFKEAWKQAEREARTPETRHSSSSTYGTTITPNFRNCAAFENGRCAYFTFQGAPGPSATSVVHHDLQSHDNTRKKSVSKRDNCTHSQLRQCTPSAAESHPQGLSKWPCETRLSHPDADSSTCTIFRSSQ